MLKKLIILFLAALLFLATNLSFSGQFLTKQEFELQKEKDQLELKSLSIALAEIKKEIVFLQETVQEIKEQNRSLIDRLLDMLLSGGLAFSSALALRRKKENV